MRVLLIKTSSLGDVIHALPAVTEACQQIPGIRFDWMVEEAFAEVPGWHPGVDRVIPVAIRRWRKTPLQALRSSEWRALRETLKIADYDLVIDAQGLLKSAMLVWLVGLPAAGYDRHSIREPFASRFYRHRYPVSRQLHAVERIRHLFAAALDYPLADRSPGYGAELGGPTDQGSAEAGNSLVWLHGSTWASKLWPEKNWVKLSRLAVDAGFEVLMPWGNDRERERAKRIATHVDGIALLPRMTLTELASVLRRSLGVVGVDGGLAHLAAAMSVPTVCLYGATSPKLTGTWGGRCLNLQGEYQCVPCLKKECIHLAAENTGQPCLDPLTPEMVMARLLDQIAPDPEAQVQQKKP